jgi:hypothetical protein
MVDTGGAQRHPGDTERLMAYWAEGEGAAKIGWGVAGDFARCEVELGKYVGPSIIKGPVCQPSQTSHWRNARARAGRASRLAPCIK